MSFELGKNSLKNREGIDDRLLDITDLAIKLTNIDFGIPNTGGLRSVEDQAKLFTAGKSKADGRTNHSYHQTGKAVDVYAYVDGKASWEKEHLAIIAAAMLQASAQLGYELKWGGLWKSWQDFPHFEIRD
jgi:peptidoglycan L-alanyl-D-glutamate endopeptidase CwlK